MFRRLGQLAARHPVQILVSWLVLLIGVLALAPKLGDVVNSSQAGFLPASANSQQAQTILQQAFPRSHPRSSAVLVLSGPQPARGRALAAYSAYIAHQLSPAPVSVASASLDRALRGALESRDGQASLVDVGWSQIDTSSAPGDAVAHLRAYIKAHPVDGITAQVTGDVAINLDYQDQISKSSNLSTIIAVFLVLGVVLVAFRSIALLLVPAATIVFSLLISEGIVAALGRNGLSISSNTPIFMIVLLVGAGTDYCLFLASRFKEELVAGADPARAIERTMEHVGEAIFSAGLALVIGTGFMGFAQLGLFNTTGPAIAISVAVTMLVALTVTPAVLRLLGRRAFWPARIEAARPSRFWHAVADRVTRRPILAIGALMVLLLPLSAAVGKTGQNFDFVDDLSPGVEANAGFAAITSHFGAGNALPGSLVIRAATSLRTATGLAALDRLDAQLATLPGVAAVQGPTRPGGVPIPFQAYASSPQVRAALSQNLSDDGLVASYTVVSSRNPYSAAARDLMVRVRGLGQAAFPGAAVHTGGESSAATDTSAITGSDLLRISLFVLGGIFVVLVLLLRAVVAPLYLLATVVLSLAATVGTTTLVFQVLGGKDGLVFWVPFLILTMLIGLGTDYNILMMSRVREEAAKGGDYRAAVAEAVGRTGGIITTCGLILAGSFGTLVLAGVSGLRELGFAVGLGVLVDTFLVRSVLVPALAVLFGRLSWLPGPVPGDVPASPADRPVAELARA